MINPKLFTKYFEPGATECGLHSGFSLCCVLWYITAWMFILRHSKWINNKTWYHRLMDRRPPRKTIQHIHTHARKETGYQLEYVGVKTLRDWGMIPCPLHLLLRRREQIYNCFCPNWLEGSKDKVLKEHPELCAHD